MIRVSRFPLLSRGPDVLSIGVQDQVRYMSLRVDLEANDVMRGAGEELRRAFRQERLLRLVILLDRQMVAPLDRQDGFHVAGDDVLAGVFVERRSVDVDDRVLR